VQRRLSLRQVERLSREYPEKVSNSYLAYCETGRLLPSLDKLITLSKVLGVPLQQFIERVELDRGAVAPIELGPDATWREMRAAAITEAEAGRLAAAYACFAHAAEMIGPARAAAGDAAARAEVEGARADLKMDMAIVLKRMSRHYTARDLLEEILSDTGNIALDAARMDRALILLAEVLREMGRLPIAAMMGREAMLRAARLGDVVKEAHAACLLGNALFDMGNVTEATPLYEKAVRAFKTQHDAASLCVNMGNLANCYVRLGRFLEGIRMLHEAETLARSSGFNRQVADILGYLGQAYALQGNLERAEKHFFQSNRIARDAAYHDIVFSNTWYLRELALKAGRTAEAADLMRSLRYVRARVDNGTPEVKAFDEMIRAADEAALLSDDGGVPS